MSGKKQQFVGLPLPEAAAAAAELAAGAAGAAAAAAASTVAAETDLTMAKEDSNADKDKEDVPSQLIVQQEDKILFEERGDVWEAWLDR